MDKKISEFIEVYTLEDNTVIPVVQGDPLYNAKISTKNFVLGIISNIKRELGDFDLDDKYLSKTKPDTAQGHMTFNNGITSKEAINFGEYTSGIHTGSGGRIDKNGKAELDSLILRSFLEVPELRYNRLEFVGDELAIGGGSVIKNVTTLSAANGAYRIELKLEDGDIGPFIKYDIIKGIFNYSGGFSTTWASVDIVEGDKNQFLNVTVRANDSKGEWRNYPPRKFMHITRWGNFSDDHKDRQSVIFLSAKTANIIILDGVNSFDGGYINSQWGKPGSLTDVGNPLEFAPVGPNDSLLYLRTLAVQDLIRIDWKGKPIREVRDRGLWSLETAQSEDYYRITDTLQDEVWHIGVKYRCMFDNTIEEPGTGSAWEVIVDLGDVATPGKDGIDGVDGKDAVAPIIIDDFWAFWNHETQVYDKSEFSSIGDDGHSPEIRDGYWWEWNSIIGEYQNTDVKAEGKDGKDGVDGVDGGSVIAYQAGLWDSVTEFERTPRSYPIVKYANLYYFLALEGKFTGGDNPALEYATNGTSARWQLVDNFKTIMTDMLIADFGKIGAAVFVDNKLISQYGVDNAGVYSENYQEYPLNFTPNSELDLLTGLQKFGKNIHFGIKNGYAVMEYYDNDGKFLYDLGPNGIGQVSVREERWTEVKLNLLSTSSFDYAEALSKPGIYRNGASYPTTYYRYTSKIIAGMNQDPNNDGRVFPSRNKTDLGISGIFCAATNGHSHGIAGGPYPSDYHPDNPAIQWTSSYIIWSQPLLIYNGGAETIGKRYSAYWTVLREGYPEI